MNIVCNSLDHSDGGPDDNDAQANRLVPEVAYAVSAGAGGSKFGSGRHNQDTFVCGPLQAHSQEHGHAMTTQQAVESGHIIAHTLRAEGHDASEDGTGRGVPLVPTFAIQERAGAASDTAGQKGLGVQSDIAYTIESRHHVQAIAFDPRQVTSPDNRSNPQVGDPCPTMHEQAGMVAYQQHGSDVGPMGTLRSGRGDVQSGVPFTFQPRIGRNGRGQPDELSPPLMGSEAGDTCDSRPCVVLPMTVRRLTPRECERLQGFPDDWTRYSDDGSELSDSARYRMLGNAVAVPVSEWIGRRIMEVNA